ncbi:unnamed protein product, partial [Clonostachys chloroleuca]
MIPAVLPAVVRVVIPLILSLLGMAQAGLTALDIHGAHTQLITQSRPITRSQLLGSHPTIQSHLLTPR